MGSPLGAVHYISLLQGAASQKGWKTLKQMLIMFKTTINLYHIRLPFAGVNRYLYFHFYREATFSQMFLSVFLFNANISAKSHDTRQKAVKLFLLACLTFKSVLFPTSSVGFLVWLVC